MKKLRLLPMILNAKGETIMNKPYIICHMMTSVDGRIDCAMTEQLPGVQEYYDTLIKVCSQPKKYTLSDAALETLSIIAYKQPITKMEIEKIRGVNSDRAVNKLVELELVKEVGRLDAPGRPMLFGTTEEFLRTFGVQSIDELPVISEDMIEQYKEEAEYEVLSEIKSEEEDDDGQLTLDI